MGKGPSSRPLGVAARTYAINGILFLHHGLGRAQITEPLAHCRHGLASRSNAKVVQRGFVWTVAVMVGSFPLENFLLISAKRGKGEGEENQLELPIVCATQTRGDGQHKAAARAAGDGPGK